MIEMKKRPLRVGFDFDGVIAYNPFRVVRAPVALFKRHVLGVKRLTFFYPKNKLQELAWKIIHESSMFPANGVPLLGELVKQGTIEAHLITARYSFLDHHLDQWLAKYRLHGYFTSVNINARNEQPHLFKERMIQKLNVSYFVEDNWDIVDYLSKVQQRAKIYWIYNLTDRFYTYPYKYPYLKKAVEAIPT